MSLHTTAKASSSFNTSSTGGTGAGTGWAATEAATSPTTTNANSRAADFFSSFVLSFSSDHILALNHAARKRPRGHVFEPDVVRQRSKQGDPTSEEHRDAGDDQALDEPCLQEALDGHAAVDIEMFHPP